MTHLENVGNGILAVDLLLHHTILVDADRGENVEHGLVHRLETIDNQSDGNLLPSGNTFLRRPAPVLGLFRFADITDVEHDAVKRTRIQGLVLVIRGDSDEQLRLTVVQLGPETVSVGLRKVIRVDRSRGVPHVPDHSLDTGATIK